MSKTKRISLTIASDILEDVDYVCNKLSVTRSSFISESLRPILDDVRRIVDFVLPELEDDSPKARNPAQVREFLEGVLKSRVEEVDQMLMNLDGGSSSDGTH